jgi:hypothetical protein
MNKNQKDYLSQSKGKPEILPGYDPILALINTESTPLPGNDFDVDTQTVDSYMDSAKSLSEALSGYPVQKPLQLTGDLQQELMELHARLGKAPQDLKDAIYKAKQQPLEFIKEPEPTAKEMALRGINEAIGEWNYAIQAQQRALDKLSERIKSYLSL